MAPTAMAPMATSTALLSGASPAMVLHGLERRAGGAAVERVLNRVRARTGRAVHRHDFSPRSWHPIDLHLALLSEVADETGRDAETLRALGRESAQGIEAAVPGAGLMLRLANPKRLMKHAPTLWRTYARFGEVRVLEAGAKGGRLAFAGYTTSPLFCRTMEGFFEGLLGRVGARSGRVREVRCMASGAPCCEFEGTWD